MFSAVERAERTGVCRCVRHLVLAFLPAGGE
jgi:hypothetical protein